jgi:hypothetical protein
MTVVCKILFVIGNQSFEYPSPGKAEVDVSIPFFKESCITVGIFSQRENLHTLHWSKKGGLL